ncbi:hypothetical protein B0H14DRAFT_2985804 [Mycena olivaceomarginata]|nr:hypothetical protein B0H14DRAFT_2985804 [Mycena olivaceomarginata]
MDDAPPAKRRRTDDADAPEIPLVRSCSLAISPQDWIHLLGAMYPKVCSHRLPSRQFSSLFAAILRLNGIRRLKTEFPTTLEEYDALNSWACIKYEEFIYFDLMRLTKELRPAFDSSRDGYIETVDFRSEDASVSPGDRLACTLGVAKLLILQSHTTMAWLALDSDPLIPSVMCIQPLKCVASVKEVILDLSEIHFPHIWVVDHWNESWDGEMRKEVFEAGRKACWDKLPRCIRTPRLGTN